ncbi:hypothetical protein C8T65DRAFT_705492 [Cerioporus squamosus]|nr:hypothetical protein C8T65DRAFT_705492 [Cerioporus squamosus]
MEPFPPGTTYPLKDWERQGKLNVELIGYGWEEKQVIVRLHLSKDPLTFMGRDVKHSKNWMCEFCGAPARETHIMVNSWHQLEPPKLIVYIHYVCDMDQRHVLDGLRMTHNMLNVAAMGRLGPFPTTFPPKQLGVTYLLAGSCACCQRDETTNDPGSLKKCSQCKLTRYCSVECQKTD